MRCAAYLLTELTKGVNCGWWENQRKAARMAAIFSMAAIFFSMAVCWLFVNGGHNNLKSGLKLIIMCLHLVVVSFLGIIYICILVKSFVYRNQKSNSFFIGE